MANNAQHAFKGVLKVDNWAGALTDISEKCTNVTLNRSRDTAEVSGFGDDDKKRVQGMRDKSLDVQGNWDAIIESILSGSGDEPATRTVEYSPTRDAGAPEFTGEIVVENDSIDNSTSDAVKFSFTLQGSGRLTTGTVS